jgi:hypothetical protein
MAAPSNASILNAFHKYPHLNHIPAYVFTNMVPGGVRDINEGLGFRRAIAMLDDESPVFSYKMLVDLNAALTYFQTPLATQDPEWPVSGPRNDKEVYYYPRCPKGYPIEKLHHLVFEGDEEKIKKYDELYEKHGSWIEVLETGLMPETDKAALFYVVSAKTHGTQGDFLLAWMKLTRNSTEKNKETGVETLTIDPILFAVNAHDLIIQHMPFVRANRRLARLLLCHTLVKNGVYPPFFWSGPSYEAKLTKHRWCDLQLIKNEQDEAKKKELQARRDAEQKDFLGFICALSTEAESIFQKTMPAGERPLEKWEGYAWRQDLKAGVLQYVTTRGRVLVPDIISAVSIFTSALGKETLVCNEPANGKGRRECWYWWEVSKELKEAIEALVVEGLIRWTEADRKEYEVLRTVPTFNSDHEFTTWKPAALAPTIRAN